MDNQIKKYTLSLFTEDNIGLINRITIIFTRRKINIVSMTTSASELDHVHRFTLVIMATPDQVEKVAKQLEKQVEILKVFFYEDHEVIFQELALYKLATESLLQNNNDIERIVREHYARILTVQKDFVVIEKTGHESETQELFLRLQPYNVLGFVRSGRVAIAKPMRRVTTILRSIEENSYTLEEYEQEVQKFSQITL